MAAGPVNPSAVATASSNPELERQEKPRARPRVLHVIGSLTLGGIETWLMQMLRHRDDFAVEHEVMVTKDDPGAYEAEARRLGVTIHKLPIGSQKLAWIRQFRHYLMDHGPFDAVHSHIYLTSAAVLAAAKAEGVPIRIAHCHAARSRGREFQTARHRLRRAIAIAWLKRVATRRLGISEAAIEEIAGRGWRTQASASILLYGFDFSRFRGAGKRAAQLRRELGLGKAPVVGHVGRLEPVKNHAFLLKAFAALLERMPEARLVLVGDGPIRAEIEQLTKSLGLGERVHFAGASDEVPAYMAMFDLFALTSFSEGLGIVCLEAQAAGTPAIVSDAVPLEVSIVPGAVQHLALSAGANEWARKMCETLQQPPAPADEWLAQVEGSAFGLQRCIDELDELYRSELQRAGV